jgi:hypothetical protein
MESIEEKIDRAIALDRKMKQQKKELDGIKAELQSAALADMENKNIKYVQFFGKAGNCEVIYKEKFEIDNFSLLMEVVGKLLKDKVTRKEEVKFEVDGRFKEVLIALFKGQFAVHDIDSILNNLGLTEKQIKVVKKKLKGDYRKDKALLESVGVTRSLEEELDAIKELKNMELIQRYFTPETIDMEKLRKSLWVEDSLSVSINYDAETGGESDNA